MKLSIDISTLTEGGFTEYCKFCGWALARAHARSGDPALISGYLGQKDVFDQAVATFAETYADQNERDHAAFLAYVQANQASVSS
jgi:NAD(P)H-dependent flavin oxidoreductase YrpB (nitropropane dioxygenase family)